jgi:outer membrane protein assembly factor BamE (lipoprotein component of BamABCDE complex)
MPDLRSAAAIVLSVIALAGCAGQPGVRDWMTIREESFKQIIPGQSTKQDVEALLGRPVQSWRYPNLAEEVWDYKYAANTETKALWVFFDPSGTVKRYQTVLPRLYQPDRSSRSRR